MLRKGFEWIISKMKNEKFLLDSKIPLLYLVQLLFKRTFMYVRGKMIFGLSSKAFIGCHTRIKFKSKIFMGNSLTIQDDCYIDALSKDGITFGDNVSIGRASAIECTGSLKDIGKGITFGNNVGLSTNCFLGCAGGIEIGNNTIIGNYVSMHSENHNFYDSKKLIREQGVNRQGIKIGENCWIGAKVTILDGTTLENGCIIAAGSVITAGIYKKDSIYGGIPAKFIKKRFKQ